MPRIHIYLTKETSEQLTDYLKKEWGGHYNQSAVVQKAIKEFLDKEREAEKQRGIVLLRGN